MSWFARREILVISLLVAAGVALRIAWVMAGGHLAPVISEMYNISGRFAIDGVLGDAFRPGQGPTAHAMPLSPMLAGAVYRVLGIGTPAAEFGLTLVSLCFTFGSFLFVYKIFRTLGTPLWACLAALALACLLPVNLSLEAVAFRTWEGALAVFLMAWVMLLVVRLDAGDTRPTKAQYAAISLLCAISFVVNQATGIACFAMLGLLAWRRSGFGAAIGAGALSLILTALILTPWMLRNGETMGERLWLRSNFGLVLATGFHDGMSGKDQRQAFVDRMDSVDPLMSDTAYARMKQMGELAYNRELADRAQAWISAHPTQSLGIALTYLRQYYFPPEWLWHIYSDRSRSTWVKALSHWLISALGLAGLAMALWRRRRGFIYVACGALIPALPYMLAQPVLRYRYLVFALLLFLAADFVACLAAARPRTA